MRIESLKANSVGRLDVTLATDSPCLDFQSALKAAQSVIDPQEFLLYLR